MFLRVPWAARRSNQSLLKEISPGISLEGMMLKLKLRRDGGCRLENHLGLRARECCSLMGLISQVVSKGWYDLKCNLEQSQGLCRRMKKGQSESVHFVIQESEESGGLE